MSLTDWIYDLFGSLNGLLAVLLAAAVFSGLYIYSASRLLGARKDSLSRIRQSLSLYTKLAGPLSTLIDHPGRSAVPEEQLIRLLQECKTADRLTHELHGQIDIFLSDRDESRLMMLYKQLNREINQLVQERDELVKRLEQPGWGMGLWLLLKPAIPALSLAAAIVWTANLVQGLQEHQGWTNPYEWCLWLSNMIATVSFYRLLMDSRKKPHGLIYILLHLLIAALALLNLVWAEASPYVLTTQILLYIAGFRFTVTRRRRERPYAGHPELLDQFVQQPGTAQTGGDPASPDEEGGR